MEAPQISEPIKETVIIVHGTWAAPDPPKRRWYQPIDDWSGDEPFTAKLDAALHKRGSPARCWAHCNVGNPIFSWSGENSWIARTHAAATLADYVTKLRKEGWRCHVVAHSHGGNLVVEALPQMAVPKSGGLPGQIVTLGTPFMNTMSLMLKRAERQENLLEMFYWALFWLWAVLVIWIAIFLTSIEIFAFYPTGTLLWTVLAVSMFVTFVAFLITRRVHRGIARRVHRGIRRLHPGIGHAPSSNGDASRGTESPVLLAISSPMDEAWQVLHHLRAIDNPFIVRSSLLSYLASSAHSRILRGEQVAHISGARSFKDMSSIQKYMVALCDLCAIGGMILILAWTTLYFIGTILPVVLLKQGFAMLVGAFVAALIFGPTYEFYSAFLSPVRWCVLRAQSLASVGGAFGTYMVRRWSWPVLLRMAMGLEGYPFKIPLIDRQHPSPVPQNFVKYEDMSRGTQQRALQKRSAWVARHLGDVSQTFSKLAVTAADITLLLRTIEEDQTLVHAAYYTDDECIARIANWIADAK
jgi:hypothetical protein